MPCRVFTLAALVLVATGASTHGGRGTFVVMTDAEVEARVRSELFPHLAEIPDGAGIRASFERAFRADATGAQELLALTVHQDEDVALWASQVIGRYATPQVASALGNVFRTDTRLLVRTGALAGLRRSGDSSAAALSIQALGDPDGEMQMLGIIMLQALGDPAQSPALLAYLDSPDRKPPVVEVLEALGTLGDPPGSTAVRDRLSSEANNKRNDWETRLEAAKGLKRMGQSQLAQLVLDRADSDETYEWAVRYLAATRKAALSLGTSIKSQAALDALLPLVPVPAVNKVDAWGQPLHAVFLREGVFNVVSGGPDQTAGTPDDITTGEPFAAYDARMFSSLFR